jgi:hypothetical protein
MGDNKSLRGSPDNKQIDIHEKYEREYWARKFGVSQKDLVSAREAAGSPWASRVEDVLRRRGKL